MKLSEKWSITGGRCDFVLTKSLVRLDEKTGLSKTSTANSFHASIEQCLTKIMTSETQDFLQKEEGQTVQQLHDLLAHIMTEIPKIAVNLEKGITNE